MSEKVQNNHQTSYDVKQSPNLICCQMRIQPLTKPPLLSDGDPASRKTVDNLKISHPHCTVSNCNPSTSNQFNQIWILGLPTSIFMNLIFSHFLQYTLATNVTHRWQGSALGKCASNSTSQLVVEVVNNYHLKWLSKTKASACSLNRYRIKSTNHQRLLSDRSKSLEQKTLRKGSSKCQNTLRKSSNTRAVTS